MTDNQADRRRRTVEAPNGARVVLPYGTTSSQVFDAMLKYVYADAMVDCIPLATPFRDRDKYPPTETSVLISGRTMRRLQAHPGAFNDFVDRLIEGSHA